MKINQMEPWYGEEEKKAVIDYLNSGGWMMEHKKTEELEKMIAGYTGSRFCSMVFNGTVSLFCALKAYDIGKGDEVLCPDYTMIATPNAIKLAGADPILCDIEGDTLCIDFHDIERKITDKTKAIMLVSINGRYPHSIIRILEFCKERDIAVIEDAAQSLGSFYDGEHVGTLGDIGSFSFSMPKIITMGQGGALVTDSEFLYQQIEMIKDFGRPQPGVDYHEIIGWNFKYTDLQSVFGIEQMKKLPERVERKKLIYQWYKENLDNVNGISFIDTDEDVAPWFIDILVDKKRSEFIEYLKKEGIGSRQFYPAIHTQPPYHYVNGDFQNSSYISQHGVWLPSASQLTESDVLSVCNVIKQFEHFK